MCTLCATDYEFCVRVLMFFADKNRREFHLDLQNITITNKIFFFSKNVRPVFFSPNAFIFYFVLAEITARQTI